MSEHVTLQNDVTRCDSYLMGTACFCRWRNGCLRYIVGKEEKENKAVLDEHFWMSADECLSISDENMAFGPLQNPA